MGAMSLLSACRVCLASDREMYSLANTALEETYERVTSGTLVVEGRPCCVCGVCLSALRRCRRFIDTAREANNALDRWIRNQPNTDTLKLIELPLFSFTRSPTLHFEITCREGIWESEFTEEGNTAENETNEITAQQNECTFDQEIKYEVTNDDGNDHTQVPDNEENDNEITEQENECTFDEEIKYEVRNDEENDNEITEQENECAFDEEIKYDICKIVEVSTIENDNEITDQQNECTFDEEIKYDICKIVDVSTIENENEITEQENECAFDEEIKYEVRNVDGNDQTQMADENTPQILYNIEFHSSRVLTIECVKIGKNQNDENDTPDASIAGLGARKRAELNEVTESGPALKKRRRITSRRRRGNTNPAATPRKEVVYYCNYCKYKTTNKSTLKTHLMRHTGEKPLKCDKCDFKCIGHGTLKCHLRTHTGEKPYACDICGSKFTQKGNYKRHLMIHTGEKPFSCHICEYKCNAKSQMNVHVLSHTGEKRFHCDICEYGTNSKYLLNKHVLAHTDGKFAFACHMCKFVCNSNFRFNRHILTHNYSDKTVTTK